MTPDDISRALFQHAPAGLLAMSTDGIISAANDTFCGWLGRSEDEVVGRYFQSLLSRSSTLIFSTQFMPLLETQRGLNEMMLTLATGGGGRDVLVSTVLVSTGLVSTGLVSTGLESSGVDPVVYAAVFDAGIRLKYERDLLDARRTAETAVARLRILQEAATGLAPATTMAAFGAALRGSAETATDAAAVSVIVTEPGGGLELVSGSRPLGGTVELAALTPLQECRGNGRPVLCRTPAEIAAAYPDLAAGFDREGVEALCIIPVIGEGAVSGAIACWFQRPRELDENLLDLLAALATQAAPVLERIHLQDQIEHQSLHDSLTGLPNRLSLQHRLRQLLGEADQHGHTVAVLFLDLDGFKVINDTFGHAAGDQVLQQVAVRLLATLRVGDTPCRLGGDEFVVVCDGVDRDSALDVARRIREAVRAPLDGIAQGSSVSASIGISVFTPGGPTPMTPDALIALADAAMLTSKRAGKGQDTLVTA